MQAPHLDTPRLTMRRHTIADFDDSFAMWSKPEVVRYVGGTPSTRDRAWSRLLTFGGLWPILGFGYWAVRERATGRYVGEVGFADFHRAIDVDFEGVPEMGWVLDTWAHGQGFAREAVDAGLAWCDRTIGSRTVCIIDPDNAPSLALAARTGFREIRHAPCQSGMVVVLERHPSP
jgi:RimJ/RimL family protein N-acetyltransferase